jgi:hypothetical protein
MPTQPESPAIKTLRSGTAALTDAKVLVNAARVGHRARMIMEAGRVRP